MTPRQDWSRTGNVWAHDMGNTGNQELLNYFQDRRVWRINGDSSRPNPESYEASP